MLKQEKLRYEMLQRVRDFGSTHQSLFPVTSAAGQAFATVVEAVATIADQSANRLVTAHAGKKAKALARKDVATRMAAIVRCARRAGRLEPAVATALRMPRLKSDIALIDAARSFIREGAAVSHQWVPLGLPETSLADLQTSVDAFERSIVDRRKGRSGQTESRTAFRDALKRGFDAVSDLDVIVSNTPNLAPGVLAVWHESRRVNPKSGTVAAEVTTPAAPAAVTTEGGSASPPETTPAAELPKAS